MAKRLTFYKSLAVSEMIEALESYASEKGISLENKIPNDVNDFDDLFNDGGEGRCENFCDLGYEYSLQFGTFDDYEKGEGGFEGHLNGCIEVAMKKV